jgi:hypothetical protein
VLVSSGVYHIIFLKWRSYSSTLIPPWVMVVTPQVFKLTLMVGQTC